MNASSPPPRGLPHSAHWGSFFAHRDGERLVVTPHPDDPSPSPILGNLTDVLDHKARIRRPMVRRGWLEAGPCPRERDFRDDLVAVGWDEVLDRLAAEIGRVHESFGPQAIYGGSYGWASAGRFHHAQSQIHRFLNLACGGYVRSVNSYSAGASSVILPHVVGPFEALSRRNVTWEQVAEHSDFVLAFGGMPLKNSMVASGGVTRHVEPDAMTRAAARGCEFWSVSPLRDDMPAEARPHWLPIRPGTDVALMLALAHTLVAEGLHDRAFLDRYCVGFDAFAGYLAGTSDGTVKDAGWAAALTGIDAATIRAIARKLTAGRSLITVAHALQRAQYGEQPVWMAAVLAAMVGQIGLPGGGYNYALGAMGHTGRRVNAVPIPTMPQGRNGVRTFIPVARIADMLLNPGAPFDYNGETLAYPEIRLVYWAGGNPFHHHQDLNRLRRAFSRVDTIICQDSAWTPMARFADIVLPATMSLERDDIGAAATDPRLIAMKRIAEPVGEARDDFEIFRGLAQRMGCEPSFTEGRMPAEWLEHLYEPTRSALAAQGLPAPSFGEFWERGEIPLPSAPDDGGLLRAFREDPDRTPLPTPSGRIEIVSATIGSFGYDDCPEHPAWLPATEQPDADAPLTLIANQPATRLHSQLDFGSYSQSAKRRGREVVRLNPQDAAARGIADGDLVRLFNARGACLAAARTSEGVMPGVVNLSTGAWYDPLEDGSGQPLCGHGNPNVVTRDVGTSRLAQGCCGQVTTVQCARFDGEPPPIRAYDPPGDADRTR
ncbi:molybdopterin guanine dinucleotide-containing S/N-oxide reductase [Bosea sp. BK604]|uniref:molybdopterin guanine dinucleotide-containing S/N-oxide reductase n=1 Tax=Bosea sp. BK604 TaxID=2512180 RepID=UPI001044ACFC|nr:molybdopterin guanine dinucleotide-containing S/N-oxide reductase [Bosea sp. BK604]TCR65540.1 biotin/methionine sulfoxide reductase [Bosea sp. BK604]